MTLDEYLKLADAPNNLEFGRLVDASEATISRVRNKRQSPSLDLMRRISLATGGAVMPNDFVASLSSQTIPVVESA